MKNINKVRLNAKGDIFSAEGDIFSAKGDIFGAKGDVFNFGVGKEPTQAEIDEAVRKYNESQEELMAEVDAYSKEYDEKNPTGFTKVIDSLSSILGIVDQGADTFNKIKYGTTVDQSGVSYDAKLGGPETKKDYTMYYIGGIVVVLLIGVGIYMSRKNK